MLAQIIYRVRISAFDCITGYGSTAHRITHELRLSPILRLVNAAGQRSCQHKHKRKECEFDTITPVHSLSPLLQACKDARHRQQYREEHRTDNHGQQCYK